MNRKRIILATIIWLFIAGIGSVITKLWIFPSQKKSLIENTSSSTQYKYELHGSYDMFPGYAPLRSEMMERLLREQSIKIIWEDDKADYVSRSKKLLKNEIDITVFTLDAMISSSLEIGEWPPSGTVILVIDQTKGADGLVSWKKSIGTINDLNREDARFVATPKSPSEFISRIVVNQFNLPRLSSNFLIEATGSKDVLSQIKKYPNKPYVFALWEPELSQALSIDGVQCLLDSSKMDGLIVDALVVSRHLIASNPELVKLIAEAYLRTIYFYSENGMIDLIAKETGNKKESERIVNGIQWANTLDNFAYLGVITGTTHIEDMIIRISNILTSTGSISKNIKGSENQLYYNETLTQLKKENFHPSRKSLLKDIGDGGVETVQAIEDLPLLTDAEWEKLFIVGNLKVNELEFSRGSSKINIQSQRDLKDLADNLTSFPAYYIFVIGNTVSGGDREANLNLAQERANVVNEYLQVLGISQNRLHTKAVIGNSSSVNFVFGGKTY